MNSTETIQYRKRLEEGGMPPAQALAHADALAEVLEDLPTKDWVRAEIGRQLQELKVDILRWMFAMFIAQTGVTIGTVVALVRYMPH